MLKNEPHMSVRHCTQCLKKKIHPKVDLVLYSFFVLEINQIDYLVPKMSCTVDEF